MWSCLLFVPTIQNQMFIASVHSVTTYTSQSINFRHGKMGFWVDINVKSMAYKLVIQWSTLNIGKCWMNCHFLCKSRGATCVLLSSCHEDTKNTHGVLLLNGACKNTKTLCEICHLKFWVGKNQLFTPKWNTALHPLKSSGVCFPIGIFHISQESLAALCRFSLKRKHKCSYTTENLKRTLKVMIIKPQDWH